MDFDVKVFKNYSLNQKKFDYDNVEWNISGNNTGKNFVVSTASTPEKMICSDFFKLRGSSSLELKKEYYDFKDEYFINNDNAYKVLSTMAFDWSVRMLFFSLIKDSKMNFNSFMRDLKSSNQDKLYDSLYKIANCYELSPLKEK